MATEELQQDIISQRPHGPNLTTIIQRRAIELATQNGGELDTESLIASSPASVQHTKGVLADMHCIGGDGVLRGCDPYKCPFGFGGTRTKCHDLTYGTEPKPLQRSNTIVFLPSEYDRISIGAFNRDSLRERLIFQVLKEFDGDISNEGDYDPLQSNDLGLLFSDGSLDVGSIALNIMRFYGIETAMNMNNEFITSLNAVEPMVVKHHRSHGGKLKFLIESQVQKIKFLTWAWLVNNSANMLIDIPEESFRNSIEEFYHDFQQYPEDLIDVNLSGWDIQRFYPGPDDHPGIIRVYTDFMGYNFYSYKHVTSVRYDQKHRRLDESEQLDPFKKCLIDLHTDGRLTPQTAESLLLDPRSPLFLDSKDFTTNYRGGEFIPLDCSSQKEGSQIAGNTSRVEYGKLPVPPQIILPSSRIGRLMKTQWPYVGTDYLIKKDGGLVFLETNIIPGLQWFMVPGGRQGMNKVQLHSLLMRDIRERSKGK